MSEPEVNDATLEFIKALEQLKLFENIEIEYRIYHDDDDNIISLSYHDHPESGKYLIVTENVYNNYMNYTLKDGRLVENENNPGYTNQLQKNNHGIEVVKNNAGIVVESTETYTETEFYEFRDN